MMQMTRQDHEVNEIDARLRLIRSLMNDESPARHMVRWYTCCARADVASGAVVDGEEALGRELERYSREVIAMLQSKEGADARELIQTVCNLIYTEAALQALEAKNAQ